MVADKNILSSIYKELQNRISLIGKAPICNQISERAPKINGYVFIFCYRCTGVILGGLIASLLKYLHVFDQSIALLIVFTLPCLIDGLLQKLNIHESTNRRRLITGLLFGVGLAFL